MVQRTSKAFPNATLSPIDAVQKSFLDCFVEEFSGVNALEDQ
jgi:hypothetical protein